MEADLRVKFEAALNQPWCAPYRRQGQVLLGHLQSSASVADALNRCCSGPLRFVAQAELPAGEGYEAFIARKACVPTRDNAHDLLNGLIWLHWPLLKARLNALHIIELTRQRASLASGPVRGPVRGQVRDALTVLDENAAFLCAPEPLRQALRRRDWQALWLDLRPLWAQAQIQLVGHALLEKLMQPRKPICAHVLLLEELSDAGVAAALGDGQWLAAKPFLPLPVLGVPGWWAANQDKDFYADASVFRPPRAVE